MQKLPKKGPDKEGVSEESVEKNAAVAAKRLVCAEDFNSPTCLYEYGFPVLRHSPIKTSHLTMTCQKFLK